MPNLDKVTGLVEAFQDFALFCKSKWRASILAIFMIAMIGGIFLLLFYGYRKIELLGTELTKGVAILEETHTTPASLQENLVASVAENLLIEKELSRLLINSKNGISTMFFKFHNSKMDLQGKHDFFYSAMNEVSKTGTENFMKHAQNVPITALGQYMLPFVEHKCQIVKTEEIVTNSWLLSQFIDEGIGAVASCPIYDISDKYLLGFVELVYPKGSLPVRTPEALEECLTQSASRLSVIISKEVELIKEK